MGKEGGVLQGWALGYAPSVDKVSAGQVSLIAGDRVLGLACPLVGALVGAKRAFRSLS